MESDIDFERIFEECFTKGKLMSECQKDYNVKCMQEIYKEIKNKLIDSKKE